MLPFGRSLTPKCWWWWWWRWRSSLAQLYQCAPSVHCRGNICILAEWSCKRVHVYMRFKSNGLISSLLMLLCCRFASTETETVLKNSHSCKTPVQINTFWGKIQTKIYHELNINLNPPNVKRSLPRFLTFASRFLLGIHREDCGGNSTCA